MRRRGSTHTPRISDMSSMSAPSATARPAMLCPPPLMQSRRPCSRANRTHSITSDVPRQRTTAAGRRSIMLFQTVRESSKPASSGMSRGPRSRPRQPAKIPGDRSIAWPSIVRALMAASYESAPLANQNVRTGSSRRISETTRLQQRYGYLATLTRSAPEVGVVERFDVGQRHAREIAVYLSLPVHTGLERQVVPQHVHVALAFAEELTPTLLEHEIGECLTARR